MRGATVVVIFGGLVEAQQASIFKDDMYLQCNQCLSWPLALYYWD